MVAALAASRRSQRTRRLVVAVAHVDAGAQNHPCRRAVTLAQVAVRSRKPMPALHHADLAAFAHQRPVVERPADMRFGDAQRLHRLEKHSMVN